MTNEAKLIAMAPTLKRLVAEARVLILAAGEHSDPSIQFPQHGWLNEANRLFPMTDDEKRMVSNHQQGKWGGVESLYASQTPENERGGRGGRK